MIYYTEYITVVINVTKASLYPLNSSGKIKFLWDKIIYEIIKFK